MKKVIFFQPPNFNRTARKTNPFFDPILKVCKDHHIPYQMFEMTKRLSPTGYTEIRPTLLLFYLEILGFRFIKKWFHFPSRPVWLIIGWIANILTFGKYRAETYITVAGVHLEIFQGINPKARLIDLQHGVIFSQHSGYFKLTRELNDHTAENPQREYWLYGEGYRRCFLRHPNNVAFLENKLHIIGDVLGVERTQTKPTVAERKDALVFSLQLTPDFDADQLQRLVRLYTSAFEKIEASGLHQRYQVLLKHHPRFGNCVDVSTWTQRFPWLVWSEVRTPDLIARTCYHITIDSTTAFEYASEGVPSWFLYDPATSSAEDSIMLGEYAYEGEGSFEEMVNALNDPTVYTALSQQAKAWYQRFYTPFTEANCLKLLGY